MLRYSEERSRSIRNSLSLDGRPLRVCSDSPRAVRCAGDDTQFLPRSPCSPAGSSKVNCELCDTSGGGSVSVVGAAAIASDTDGSPPQT